LLHSEVENSEGSQIKDIEVKVNRKMEDFHTVKFILLITVTFGVILLSLSVYYQFMTADELIKRVNFVSSIGIIRKNLMYMSFFSYQTVGPYPNFSYATLIAPEAREFYHLSSQTFNELGNTVFKNVYAYVEMIQAYFVHSSSYPIAFLQQLYETKISVVLQQACDNILEMDLTVFAPTFRTLISEDQQR
jgi:hypothetical protein